MRYPSLIEFYARLGPSLGGCSRSIARVGGGAPPLSLFITAPPRPTLTTETLPEIIQPHHCAKKRLIFKTGNNPLPEASGRRQRGCVERRGDLAGEVPETRVQLSGWDHRPPGSSTPWAGPPDPITKSRRQRKTTNIYSLILPPPSYPSTSNQLTMAKIKLGINGASRVGAGLLGPHAHGFGFRCWQLLWWLLSRRTHRISLCSPHSPRIRPLDAQVSAASVAWWVSWDSRASSLGSGPLSDHGVMVLHDDGCACLLGARDAQGGACAACPVG